MKLKSKNLTAGDNTQRFQKGTTESEDNYQKSNYQVGGIEQKGGISLRAKRDTYKPTINSGLYITVDGNYPKELCLGLGLALLIYLKKAATPSRINCIDFRVVQVGILLAVLP